MTLRHRVLLAIVFVAATEGVLIGQNNDRFAALLGLARVKRDAGDLTAADRYFDDARRVHDLRPDEWAEYFWVLAELDPGRSVLVARNVLKAMPGRSDIRDRAIAAAVRIRDEDAVEELASAGERHDARASVWPRRLGESLLRRDLAGRAAPAYRRAAEKPDATVGDRAGLALALEAAGQYPEAVAAWNAVAPETRAAHVDWEHSRLRALAGSAPAGTAAVELDAWIRIHPEDRAMRAVLVELWARTGRTDRALATLSPLLTGPDREKWQRREVDLLRATDRRPEVIALLEARVARGRATLDDRWSLAELLADTKAFDALAPLLPALTSAAETCDDRLLRLLDRVPGASGTTLLVTAIQQRGCQDHPAWLSRGVERAVADRQHAAALELLERLPSSARDTHDLRRLDGQLRLWTGHPSAALAGLSSVVAEFPDDRAARETLVDAYRANGQPYDAWRAAGPLVGTPDLPRERVVSLAALALEADRPAIVPSLVGDLIDDVELRVTSRSLLGRALLASGRPDDAVKMLEGLDRSKVDPAAALALIDSVSAMRGYQAALAIADGFVVDTDGWKDVLIRRAVLGALTGHDDAAARDRAALARIDPALLIVVDTELSLRRERPHQAVSALADARTTGRLDDLRATALAGTDELAAASTALASLRAQRPESAALLIREAELAWRLQPGPDTLAAVLALPARLEGNQNAATAAARVLASAGRHEEVLAALGGTSRAATWSVDARVLAARSLVSLRRPQEALDMLGDGDALWGTASVLRAQLVAQVQGPAAAARAFREMAARPDAGAEIFLAWAGIEPSATARGAVLEEALSRFPTRADVAIALAAARDAAGDADGRRIAAEQAVTLDPHASDAWFHLIDATITTRAPGEVADVLDRFEATVGRDHALVIGMAERVAGLVRASNDPLIAHTLSWLADPSMPASLGLSRDLARVRVLAAAERWPEALAAIDAAIAAHGHVASPMRLRADVLSWAGRHDAAIAAYDDYLAVVPADLDARRQQARVAGWAGRGALARTLYARLRARVPTDAMVAAEAPAKLAFISGRWREAATAYRAWIALEPTNSEARFEYAEALRAAGDLREADAVLADLVSDTGHRLAAASRARARYLRAPSVAVKVDDRSANGYESRRLLDLQARGVAMSATFGERRPTTMTIETAHVRAAAVDAVRTGYTAGASATHAFTGRLSGRAGITLWDLSRAGAPVTEFTAAAVWTPADRWTVSAGAARELVIENLYTLDRRLTATGLFGAALFESPRASLEARTTSQDWSDGNRRTRVSVAGTRVVSERVPQVRAIVWAEHQMFTRASANYFAPRRFLRVDSGLEYTMRLSKPRFRGDRRDEIAVGYLLGTDSHGALYQHPTVRLGWEFASGLTLDARAGMIRSRAYNDTTFTVSLRVTGGSVAARSAGQIP